MGVIARPFGKEVRSLFLAGGGIQLDALVPFHEEQAVITRHQISRVLILEHPGADRSRIFTLPQEPPVVGVVSHDAVLALGEETAIDCEGTDGPIVAVDHLSFTGITIPQHPKIAVDPVVISAGGVPGFPVLVGPAPGSWQGGALQQSVVPALAELRPLRLEIHARQPGVEVRGLARPETDQTADRFDMTGDRLRRQPGGQRPCQNQGVGNHQVGEIVGIRQGIQITAMNRNTVAIPMGPAQ